MRYRCYDADIATQACNVTMATWLLVRCVVYLMPWVSNTHRMYTNLLWPVVCVFVWIYSRQSVGVYTSYVRRTSSSLLFISALTVMIWTDLRPSWTSLWKSDQMLLLFWVPLLLAVRLSLSILIFDFLLRQLFNFPNILISGFLLKRNGARIQEITSIVRPFNKLILGNRLSV